MTLTDIYPDFVTQAMKNTDFAGYNGGGIVNMSNKALSINLKYKYAGTKISSGKIVIYALKHNVSDEENL